MTKEKLNQDVTSESVRSKEDLEITQAETTEAHEEQDIVTDVESEDDAKSNAEIAIPQDLALGSDSTAAADIITFIEEDEGDLLGDSELDDAVEGFLNPETEFESNEEKLEAGQDLLRRFFIQQNRSWAGMLGTFAGYAVKNGRILIELKALVKACGNKWEPWAAENLKFMKPRTRQAFMQLAAVPGIDDYLHFGKERLLVLDSATKGFKGEDPIGDFLKSHELYFDPDAEIDLHAYQDAVDLALDHERVKNAGIEVQKDSIKKYKMDGKKVDGQLIKTLKAVQKSGGNPNTHLVDPPGDDDEDDGNKRVQSFKKLAVSLLGTIDWIVGHPDFINKVDADKLDELTDKLASLKGIISQSESDDNE